jgi:hypothetical protein
LVVEDGGDANGGFLRASLIDERCGPSVWAVDGTKGASGVSDSSDDDSGAASTARPMMLKSS